MKKNKKVLCFITGGHRYKDSDRKVTESKDGKELIFEDVCCKCGKITIHRIDTKRIFPNL